MRINWKITKARYRYLRLSTNLPRIDAYRHAFKWAHR